MKPFNFKLTNLPELHAAMILSIFLLLPVIVRAQVENIISGVFPVTNTTANITTDKADYKPGDIVIITGSHWEPLETVKLVIKHLTYTGHPEEEFTVEADESGDFIMSDYVIAESDLGESFLLTATGQKSGYSAETTFTDSYLTSFTISAQSPNPVVKGGTATFWVTASRTQDVDFTVNLSISPNPFPNGETVIIMPPSLHFNYHSDCCPWENSDVEDAMVTIYTNSNSINTTFTITGTIQSLTSSGSNSASGNLVVCTPPETPIGTASQTLCAGSTVADLTASGTDIKWYAFASGGTALATSTVLVNGTHYYASQTVSGCESTDRIGVEVTINPASVGGSINGSATVCMGTNSGGLTLSGYTGNIVRWEYSINEGSTWTNIANTSASQSYSNIMNTTLYRAAVKSGVCDEVYSGTATITVDVPGSGGTIQAWDEVMTSGEKTVCSGTNSTSLVIVGHVGSVVRWEYSTIGGSGWANISNTVNTYNAVDLMETTSYRALVHHGVCDDVYSSIFTITVNPGPELVITDPPAVCSPGTVNLTAASVTNGSDLAEGTILTYWQDAGTTITLTTPAAVTVGGKYYIKATTPAGCSDMEEVNVTFYLTPSITLGTSPAVMYETLAAVLPYSGATGNPDLYKIDFASMLFTDVSWTALPSGTITITIPNEAGKGTYYATLYVKNSTSGCESIGYAFTITINPKPVCGEYTGTLYANTSLTDFKATITLSILVSPIPDGTTSCTFTISPGNIKKSATYDGAGTFTATYPVTLNKTNLFEISDVTWEISGNYTNLDAGCESQATIITVTVPSSDFITGGGYTLTLACEPKAIICARSGSKTNFGFVSKFNNKLSNLQGSFDAIVQADNGKTYQVKTNKPSILNVPKPYTDCSTYAAITYINAIIKEIGCKNCETLSNGKIELRVADCGEPATNLISMDKIGFAIFKSDGLLWYSTNTYNKTSRLVTPQNLAKGNIQIHLSNTKSAEIELPVSNVSEPALRVYPNPFRNRLLFEFISPVETQARIDLFDLTGHLVITIFDNPVKTGVTYQAGFTPRSTASELYFYRLTLGNAVFNGKAMYKK
jgi:hypothetical protein